MSSKKPSKIKSYKTEVGGKNCESFSDSPPRNLCPILSALIQKDGAAPGQAQKKATDEYRAEKEP